MVCPNCGAELEQHSFADICPYCGYLSVKNTLCPTCAEENKAMNCYAYIEKNIHYLKCYPEFASIKQNGTSFEIQCLKAFHPLDNQYQLCHDIELRWKATFYTSVFCIVLLSKGMKSMSNTIILVLDENHNIILHKTKESALFDEYYVLYNDFKSICNSSTLTFAFNSDLKYDEFRIYTHRFYNLVFNRTKYVYAMNQKLLTD